MLRENMSGGGGGGGGGSRVSIPADLRKTIQNIKEITDKQHSDEDVYAVLKDCAMDPNETAQKLLFEDTYHEVKSKKERRKESTNGRSPESKSTTDTQGRGARGNRHPRSNYVSSGGERNMLVQRGKRTSNSVERVPNPMHLQMNKNTAAPRATKASNVVQNGPSHLSNGLSAKVHAPNSAVNGSPGGPDVKSAMDLNTEVSLPPIPATAENKLENSVFVSDSVTRAEEGKSAMTPDQLLVSATSASASDISSVSDPVLAPSVPWKLGADSIDNEKASNEMVPVASASKEKSLDSVVEFSHGHSSQLLPTSMLTRSGTPMTTSSSKDDDKSQLEACDPLEVVASKVALDKSKASSHSLSTSSISDGQHVIFPNHFQVSEAFKNSLTFGSFDTCLGARAEIMDGSGTVGDDKSNLGVESSQGSDVTVRESSPSNQIGNLAEHPEASALSLETVQPSLENKVLSFSNSMYDQAKQNLSSEAPQNHVAQDVPGNNSFGLMPSILGSQFVQLEGPEVQARDVSRPSNFMNGNASALSSPSPTTTPTPQSTVAMSPQPVPIFRQPYPLNYFPYGHYLPPYYMPPMHQLISHNGFTQQPSAGNFYLPPAVAAQGIKYSFPSFKPGSTATPIGIPSAYAAYGPTPIGYNPSPAVTSGTSTMNEDHMTNQLKESHPYSTAQPNEGSAVWIPPVIGQDLGSLQVNPLFSLPQGPHVTFSPAQAGHGAYGMHQPTQTMAVAPTVHPLLQQSQSGSVETAGLPTGAYQHAQHNAQINWNSNF
ncbi:GBF-interacting protein 1-like [Rhodamnia argentea]|uniref:GBF-interacting protein 1-like n=1 Tax=Rhodamnia argentea TaxID=178133 RepID=A0A8B8QR65_9MYRT|nr:GBF-interacting protein 1-like [Rhodamnia argentea]